MLEQKDLQAIEILLDIKLDQKFDQKFRENNKILKDEVVFETKLLIQENNKALKNEIVSEAKVLILKNSKILKDEIISEIGEITSAAFSNVEASIDHLEDKMDDLSEAVAKCPTREEVFSWADRRLVDLEIAKDRHDYLHINELTNLPLPIEISKTLIKRGFKRKIA